MISFKRNGSSSGAQYAGRIRVFAPPAEDLSLLNVGLISDGGMYSRLFRECNCIKLDEKNRRGIIADRKISLLLIASLTGISGGLLSGSGENGDKDISLIISECKANGIPVVIWDGSYAGADFSVPDFAGNADHIFCADGAALKKYKSAFPSVPAGFLPLAVYTASDSTPGEYISDGSSPIRSGTFLPETYFNMAAAGSPECGYLPPAAKIFFGDTLISGDMNPPDADTLRSHALTARKKALREDLYADRLDCICKTVFGVSLTEQPSVTVFARPTNRAEIQRIERIFSTQTYANKKLVFITSLTATVKKAAGDGYCCFFAEGENYPKNYISDLMLTVRPIGASGAAMAPNGVRPVGTVCAHTDSVLLSRAVVKTECISDMRIRNINAKTAVTCGGLLLSDSTETIKNAPYCGVSITDIIKRINRFYSTEHTAELLTINGEQLLTDKSSAGGGVSLSVSDGKFIVTSELDRDRHEYIFLPSARFSAEKYARLNKMTALFKCSKKNMEFTCVLLFFDSELNRLGASYPGMNTKTTVTLPENTAFVQPGFRAKGSGSASVDYICISTPDDTSPEFMQSAAYSSDGENKISVYGSCVSRDLFNFPCSSPVELAGYVARQSVFSAVCGAVKFDRTQLTLPSAFQNRMVAGDFDKNAFDILREKSGDYLLIDLIDERFPLKIIDNSYITRSNEFRLSVGKSYEDCPQAEKIIGKNGLTVNNENAEKYIRMFCRRIRAVAEPEHIILHRAVMAQIYCDANNNIQQFNKTITADNQRLNDILNAMYDMLERYLPGVRVVSTYRPVAAQTHRWGLAPMHYTESYYNSVMTRIVNIVNGK